jgi:hypothetical protein
MDLEKRASNPRLVDFCILKHFGYTVATSLYDINFTDKK